MAGDHECLLPCAQGEAVRTCSISHQPWLLGSPRAAPSPPGCRCWSLGCSNSSLRGMQLETSGPLAASWSPASSTRPPWASPACWQSHGRIKKHFSLSQFPTCHPTARPWGRRWGCGHLQSAFISLKMSVHPCLQIHSSLSCSFEVFFLFFYMPLTDRMWPVVVEIPVCECVLHACACFFFFFFFFFPSLPLPSPSKDCMLQLLGGSQAALTFHLCHC